MMSPGQRAVLLNSFHPRKLFAGGRAGDWWTGTDLSTLFQDQAGTIPVTANDQVVGRWNGKVNSLVLHQDTDTSSMKPLYKSALRTVQTDGVDDFLISSTALSITASPMTICGVFDQSLVTSVNGAVSYANSSSVYRAIGLWTGSSQMLDRAASNLASGSLAQPGSTGVQSIWGLFDTAAAGGNTFFFVETATAAIASPSAHSLTGSINYGRLRPALNYTVAGFRELLVIEGLLNRAQRDSLRRFWGAS